MLAAAYEWLTTGTGPAYQELQRMRVKCLDFGVEVMVGSHRVVQADQGGEPPPPHFGVR